jgi:hypothetical protein
MGIFLDHYRTQRSADLEQPPAHKRLVWRYIESIVQNSWRYRNDIKADGGHGGSKSGATRSRATALLWCQSSRLSERADQRHRLVSKEVRIVDDAAWPSVSFDLHIRLCTYKSRCFDMGTPDVRLSANSGGIADAAEGPEAAVSNCSRHAKLRAFIPLALIMWLRANESALVKPRRLLANDLH